MSSSKRSLIRVARVLTAVVAVLAFGTHVPSAGPRKSKIDKRLFTTAFRIDDCTFLSTGSANPYFILDPSHELNLEGEEGKEFIELRITVLNDTEDVTVPGLGIVRTRVVEEREWADGELKEVSRNFFAICAETSDVYYFGEHVDNYENGSIANHNGSWRAGTDGALPGLIMPGTFLLGSRYFQEVAPGVALDRGENTAMGLVVTVPAGTFPGSVSVFETSPPEPNAKSVKTYAPGVGLLIDDTLQLIGWTPAP